MKKNSLTIGILSIATVLSFALAFHDTLISMFKSGFTWNLLIPIVVIYLLWTNRNHYFSNLPASNPLPGIVILTGAFLMAFAGKASSTLIMSEFAVVIGIWGAVILFGGITLFRRLLWPMLYLFFLAPSIDALFNLLTPFFRTWTAYVSAYTANLFGYTVLFSKTYIRLPYMILNVADACSGINHLISLVTLTIPLAIVTQRKTVFSILLIIISVPVALFSNSLRVLFLIVYNHKRVIFAHGPDNILATEFGFFTGLVIMFIIANLFSRIGKAKKSHRFVQPASISQKSVFSPKPQLYLVIIFLVGAAFLNLWKVKDAAPPQFPLTKMATYPDYTIEQINAIPELDSLPIADLQQINKITHASSSYLISYVGWYKRQTQQKEVAGYGYDRLLDYYRTYNYNGSGNISPFRIYTSKKFQSDFHYWIVYRSMRQYTSSPITIKILSTLDALLNRSTSASVIILAIPNDISRSIFEHSDKKSIDLLEAALKSIEYHFE